MSQEIAEILFTKSVLNVSLAIREGYDTGQFVFTNTSIIDHLGLN